jgi:hypothetical protein
MPDKGLSLWSIVRGLVIAGCVRPSELTLLLTQFHLTRRTRWGLRLVRTARWHWVVSNHDQAGTLAAYGIGARVLRPRIPASKISSRERSAARAALGLPRDREIFLHVGHATQGRNLRALAPLASRGTLVLVLSDAFREEPGALPAGEDVVVVRGFVPDLGDYYRAADVYVFPTVDSASVIGIPVSIVESLANGTPVVAVRSPMVEAWRAVPGVVLVDSADEVSAAAMAAVGRTAAAANVPGVEECGDDFEVCRRLTAA